MDGEFLENQWKQYGLTLSASGGFGDLPRLFDTSVYRDPDSDGGDSYLGAPNQACKPPGPGRAIGGAPGMEGENCDPLGNVLIIQEEGSDSPDDSGAGGEILFSFNLPATEPTSRQSGISWSYQSITMTLWRSTEVLPHEAAEQRFIFSLPNQTMRHLFSMPMKRQLAILIAPPA